jgi:PAS domain S-box-containing protein
LLASQFADNAQEPKIDHITMPPESPQIEASVAAELAIERHFVAALLDTIGAMVVVFSTEGRIVRFNRACETISGYQSNELLGEYAWQRLIPSGDVAAYIENFERIRGSSAPITYEGRWIAADGSIKHIEWSATGVTGETGGISFVIATGIDVTSQRAAEASIVETETRYREIVDGSLGFICAHDLQGVILSINQHGARTLGYAAAEIVGHPLMKLVPPEKRESIQPYMKLLLTKGEAQGLLPLQRKTGDERVLAFRSRLCEASDGRRYALAFGVDITEQVAAEEKLRSVVRQSDSILESVGDGILGLDLEGCVTVVNPAAAEMLGYRPDDLLGREFHALVQHTHADGTPYPAAESPIRRSVNQRNTVRVANEVFWRRDGTSFPVEYVVRPQLEFDREEMRFQTGETVLSSPLRSHYPGADRRRRSMPGRPVGIVIAFTDISERNALDRMKDEFISTVSHELRTPLTALRGALGLLSSELLIDRPDKFRLMMQIAVANTERLSKLVNDILDIERIDQGKAELHYSVCSIEALMRAATMLMEQQAAAANIAFTIGARDVEVYADPDRLQQTFLNLISNAIKFSAREDGAFTEVHLRARYLSTEEAILEVEDHGRGIPEDKLEAIFERFYQVDASDTRSRGGSGLGLAICRSIITQHGGRIWATSTPGKGTAFHIKLPTRARERLS